MEINWHNIIEAKSSLNVSNVYSNNIKFLQSGYTKDKYCFKIKENNELQYK